MRVIARGRLWVAGLGCGMGMGVCARVRVHAGWGCAERGLPALRVMPARGDERPLPPPPPQACTSAPYPLAPLQDVLRQAAPLRALAVRGNHDDACLAAWLGLQRTGRLKSEKLAWVRGMGAEDAAVLQVGGWVGW